MWRVTIGAGRRKMIPDPGSLQQLARRRGCGQLTEPDFFLHNRQNLANLRAGTECLTQPGIDTLPHPGQRLLLSAHGQPAVGGLHFTELDNGPPECIEPFALEAADL